MKEDDLPKGCWLCAQRQAEADRQSHVLYKLRLPVMISAQLLLLVPDSSSWYADRKPRLTVHSEVVEIGYEFPTYNIWLYDLCKLAKIGRCSTPDHWCVITAQLAEQ